MLLAFFVVAIGAEEKAEKLTDDKSVTNAEGSVKGKRGIHFHTYSAPYVYHTPVVHSPLVVHHAAPIIHHSAPIIHHSIVAHPVYSHAPLVAIHHFKRR